MEVKGMLKMRKMEIVLYVCCKFVSLMETEALLNHNFSDIIYVKSDPYLAKVVYIWFGVFFTYIFILYQTH